MDAYIREIQLAAMLGYTESEEFKRAIASGDVPAPAMYLASRKRKPIWLRADIEEWLGRTSENTSRANVHELVKQIA